jgi:hypothetical protein
MVALRVGARERRSIMKPNQAELDRIVRGATSLRVRGVDEGDEDEVPRVYYDTSKPEEVAEFRECLRIRDGGVGHCMCDGTLLFELSGGEVPGDVSLHHGVTVWWEPFFDNAQLVSPDAIMDWLSSRGITFVRDEYEKARGRSADHARAAERWQFAMPRSLRPFFDDMRGGAPPHAEWRIAIAAEFPDTDVRARVLLEWYGSGLGPWSGFPAYEGVAENLLLELPLGVLVRAFAREPRSKQVVEGMARLFGGWPFGKRRPKDLAQLPADIKRHLLEHGLRSDDDDKKQRARHAFR